MCLCCLSNVELNFLLFKSTGYNCDRLQKMAIILHPFPISTGYVMQSWWREAISSPLESELGLWLALGNRMWQEQCWKVQSLGFKSLCIYIFFHLWNPAAIAYKEAHGGLWKRRNPLESDSFLPATSAEPSGHPVDHRYASVKISQASPHKTFWASQPKLPNYRIKN